jgi:hypothetical protein
MKRTLLFLLVALFLFTSACREKEAKAVDAGSIITSPSWDHYDRYKEPSIKNRFFKHSDIVPLIEKHVKSGMFRHEILGASVQGRSIHHLTLGNGKTKVLLWSQMHGDEATATMALFDLFNFFTAKDEYDPLRNYLLSNLELHFVPMLNPDGAEVWQRRNALDIDVNRDARILATPEGRILKEIGDKLKPEFGFNLHDQSTLYTAGSTRQPATISFLAPAYNYEKDMNDVRKKATQVILVMNRMLQTRIPGKVAKYNDEHDPRCFGDNFQGWGTSAILIESGGYPQDVEKQHIRKVNFYALMTAFESIAKQDYAHEDLKDYDAIPENSRFLYDLVVRNVQISKGGQTFKANLGINRAQIKNADYRGVYFRGNIDDMGDMDRHFGYEEGDAASLKFTTGKIMEMTKTQWENLKPEEELDLIKKGYLFVRWKGARSPSGAVYNHLLNLTNAQEMPVLAVAPGQPANFLLTRDNIPVYAVINGFWVDLAAPVKALPNTMGF